MGAPSLRPVGNAFRRDLNHQRSLLTQAMRYQVAFPGGLRPLRPAELASIAELAHLRIFMAWERFLEQSFLRYMCGGSDPNVRVRCFVGVPSVQHAESLIAPEGRPYAEWADPSRVRERARRFFRGGEPFWTALGLVAGDLEKMRKIRNCIVHPSKHAREQFERVVREGLGHVPAGIAPGSFLLLNAGAGPRNFLDTYIDTLSTISERIVS